MFLIDLLLVVVAFFATVRLLMPLAYSEYLDFLPIVFPPIQKGDHLAALISLYIFQFVSLVIIYSYVNRSSPTITFCTIPEYLLRLYPFPQISVT